MKITRIIPLLLVSFTIIQLFGCAYRPTVEQGNLISHHDMLRVKIGMPINEVLSTLGHPVLKNVYPDGRIIYVYSLQKNHHHIKNRSLVLTLKNGRISHIERNAVKRSHSLSNKA